MDKALGYNQTVNTTGGGSAQTKSSDFVANLAGADGLLDKADIDEIIKQANDASDNVVGNVNYQGKKFGVTHDQLKVLTDLQTAWNAAATGEIDKIPETFNGVRQRFIEFNKKYERNQLIIDNAQAYLMRVNNTAVNAAAPNLTEAEKRLLVEFESGKKIKVLGTTAVYNKQSIKMKDEPIYDPEYAKLLAKIDNDKLVKTKKSAFEAAGQAYNYYETILNLTDEKNKVEITNLVTRLAPSGEGNITPRSIRRTDDGKKWKIIYTYGTNDALKGSVDVEESALKSRVPMLKYPELQESFRYGDTETKQFSTYIRIVPKVASGQTPVETIQPIAYKIFKKAEGDFVPVIVYKDKNYEINSNQKLTNTDLAYDLLESVTKVKYESLDQLLQGIDKHNNQF